MNRVWADGNFAINSGARVNIQVSDRSIKLPWTWGKEVPLFVYSGTPQPFPGTPQVWARLSASAQTGYGASVAALILNLSCKSWSQVFPGDASGLRDPRPSLLAKCPVLIQVLLEAKHEKLQDTDVPFSFSKSVNVLGPCQGLVSSDPNRCAKKVYVSKVSQGSLCVAGADWTSGTPEAGACYGLRLTPSSGSWLPHL